MTLLKAFQLYLIFQSNCSSDKWAYKYKLVHISLLIRSSNLIPLNNLTERSLQNYAAQNFLSSLKI